MQDIFKSSKLFHYLFQDFEEETNIGDTKKEKPGFGEEIINLLSRKTDELGTVLKCHLIIEYYIDKFMIAAYPTIHSWQSSRLTFSQKLELLNNSATPIGFYYKGIKCLNSLRNKFSHKIFYKIERTDYKEIEDIMTKLKKSINEPIPEGLELIESFTLWICANINGFIIGIQCEGKVVGISAFLRCLQNMRESDE